jgi:hypothetical protein
MHGCGLASAYYSAESAECQTAQRQPGRFPTPTPDHRYERFGDSFDLLHAGSVIRIEGQPQG